MMSLFKARPTGAEGARVYHTVKVNDTQFVIDKRYQNLAAIGSGAYGQVVSATDAETGRKVAIKRIANLWRDLVDAKRILRELKLQRHLAGHDNITELRDIMVEPAGSTDFSVLYLVTDLYECDLTRIISSKQPLSDQHTRYFTYQILRGLKYMHTAHVLHRDLKPSNLLVNSNCDLAICDFGLSRGVSEDEEEELTEYVVTRWYRAPELLCGCSHYTAAVDVWSVGCILAELMHRKPLLRGSSTRNQLEIIMRVTSNPSPEDLAYITSQGAHPAVLDNLRRMPPTPAVDLSRLLPTANPDSIDLLRRMLVFNPSKRISIEEALAHKYFAELHSADHEPACDKPFDYTFEADYPRGMPVEQIQRHMLAEMHALRAEQEAEKLRAAVSGGVSGPTGGGAGSGSGGSAH